jgi:hypothetical protein
MKETVIRGGHFLFQELLQFVVIFEIIQINNVQGKLQNVCLREKNGMYCGNVEITAISEIHKFYISVILYLKTKPLSYSLLLLIKF